MPDMDTSRYYRPVSPSRRLTNPMRASTGTVGDLHGSYDPYYHHSSPRTSRDAFTNPRSSAERVDDAHHAVPRIYKDQSPPSAQLREYRTRPRRSTLEVPNPRHSLNSLPSRSPTRARPIVHAPTTARTSSPLARTYDSADDEAYYLTPASAARRQHRRIYSVDGHHQVNRLGSDDESRERVRRAAERGYLPTKRYPGERQRTSRYDEGDYYGYSYTDPKEQMYRDTAPRRRSRRSSYDGAGRNGTWSMSALEGTLPRTSVTREAGPPPSTRGFDKIARSESLRGPTRPYASERSSRDYIDGKAAEIYDAPSSRTHRPVAVHQDHDRAYPYRDDEPDIPRRSRPAIDDDVERRGFGIRTGGPEHTSPRSSNRELYAPYHADDEYYGRYARDPRDYEYDQDYDYDYRGYDRDRGSHRYEKTTHGSDEDSKDNHGRHSRESSDEEARERRRRRREQQHRESDALEYEDRRRASERDSDRDRDRDSDRSYDSGDRHHHHHHRRHRKHHDRDSGDDTDATRASRSEKPLQIVSPPEKEREKGKQLAIKEAAEAPIKGILKEPTQKFPEDPAPIREGVAPLKEAGKKGIPPTARWTKIDRRLVNPEALEEAHERFEERLDYVIVLRVLTKEEIQVLAAKTQQLRDARYERERHDRRRRHDEEDRTLRAIEAGEATTAPPSSLPAIEPAPRDAPGTGATAASSASAAPSSKRVIVEQQHPSSSAAATAGSSSNAASANSSLPPASLRENPYVPGTYTGYRRNPPQPTTMSSSSGSRQNQY
ncbi:hypothetical protein L228DRAFT_142833 [Xylona heveae TC161]|uniref:DUF8035 domain-containing protein n=1 Tax=Xylona heveae (strain CBS 132557 / TC161) TaxID=1328760 RepID=A0A165H767_XYLHT|nr:hypothetical protein L228DRAFT_142833 [Xylona heveae TC161]KZF23081.1 hypothetical protein L228DRAFT_142833 [Xylona heveae TC161]